MSVFGGKADMTFCANPLSRSLCGAERTSPLGSGPSYATAESVGNRWGRDVSAVRGRVYSQPHPTVLQTFRSSHKSVVDCLQPADVLGYYIPTGRPGESGV